MTNPDELRELLEKATKGPWITHRLFPDRVIPEGHALRPVGGAEGEAADRDDYAMVIAWPRDDRHGRCSGRANAALIATAVSSLPALLDAQAEAERLREDVTVLLAGADADAILLTAAQARADRLEGALREAEKTLRAAGNQFSEYADGHAAKGATDKAERNATRAVACWEAADRSLSALESTTL